MNSHKIPTFIAIFLLVVGVGVGVFAVGRQQNFRLGASPELTPHDVKTTNITGNSLTVTWTTDKATSGVLSWGDTPTTNKVASSVTGSLSKVHSVTLTGLSTGKTYYYRVNSGGTVYDNNGVAWSTQTLASSSSTNPKLLAGSILDTQGAPAKNALVFLTGSSIQDMSAVSSDNGNWSVTVPSPTDTNSVVDIFVLSADQGIATAQIKFKDASQTPAITIGKTYDFRNLSSLTGGNPGTGEVGLPEDENDQTSKFSVSDSAKTTEAAVSLKSVTEGEKIFTKKPEFFGDGPAGKSISITVKSDPINATVKVATNGSWRWTPPSTLEEGEHTITISWRDANNILRTLTRNFEVRAASDEPAFESTPSATKTPTATATPKPTATASATPRPTATPATESSLPNAGSTTQTLLMILAGIMLTSTGVFIYKKS